MWRTQKTETIIILSRIQKDSHEINSEGKNYWLLLLFPYKSDRENIPIKWKYHTSNHFEMTVSIFPQWKQFLPIPASYFLQGDIFMNYVSYLTLTGECYVSVRRPYKTWKAQELGPEITYYGPDMELGMISLLHLRPSLSYEVC